MGYIFEFDQQLAYMSNIDIENIGDCAIEANNDDGFFWYLIVKTSLGTSTICTCGPVVPDVDLLPSGFSQSLNRMPYKEDKLVKTISLFLNDRGKKITKAIAIPIEDAAAQFRDLSDYVERLDEGLY